MANEYISPVAGLQLVQFKDTLEEPAKSQLRDILTKYGVGRQVPALFKPREVNNVASKDGPDLSGFAELSEQLTSRDGHKTSRDPGIVDYE